MAHMSPITDEEADAFAAKFTGWTQQLTDRERMMLGAAIAASRDEPIGVVPTTGTLPLVGPVIGAVLAVVAATFVLIGEVEAKELEKVAASKDREAATKDLGEHLGRQSPDHGITDARRGRDLGLPDDN